MKRKLRSLTDRLFEYLGWVPFYHYRRQLELTERVIKRMNAEAGLVTTYRKQADHWRKQWAWEANKVKRLNELNEALCTPTPGIEEQVEAKARSLIAKRYRL